MIRDGTPVERHRGVLVKMEDMCCPYPGPGFSKIRGVVAHIARRPERTIGVLDTYHSKAGWAVAYVCRALGRDAVVYWPRRKADPPGPPIRESQARARELGAATVALQAGRSAILYHRARHDLARIEPRGDGYMMPNALKLPESVEETAAEVRRTAWGDVAEVVVSVSSGTIAAGVIRGLASLGRSPRVVLHLGYSRPRDALLRYVEKAADVPLAPFRPVVVDEGYAYGDRVDVACPFPCDPYYDLKAWRWLTAREPREGILFWNIGS